MRIVFEKGIGGVVNIVNGSIKSVDRDELMNIEEIDKVSINPLSFSPLGFNFSLNAMQVGGYIIVFDSINSMKPYLEQIDMVDGEEFNPAKEGIRKPYTDPIRIHEDANIIPHTYNNTDIEQDLINKEENK